MELRYVDGGVTCVHKRLFCTWGAAEGVGKKGGSGVGAPLPVLACASLELWGV